MKRLILLLLFSFFGIATMEAQVVYTPFVPKQSSTVNQSQNIIVIPDFSHSVTYNNVPRTSKTGEQLINIPAFSISAERVYDAQVKETTYSDGSTYYKLMGLKVSGAWQSVECNVGNIVQMLSATDLSKEEKELLLGLSEYSTHLVSINNDIILLGLKYDMSNVGPLFSNQETLLIMRIKEAYHNSNNYTSMYKELGAKLYLYIHNDKVCLANVAENKGTQSYGYLYDVKIEQIGEKHYINAIWEFANTYDDIEGKLKIEIVIDKKNNIFNIYIKTTDYKESLFFTGGIEQANYAAFLP